MLKAKIHYGNNFENWSDETFAKFKALWPGQTTENKKSPYYSYETQRLTMEEAFELEQLGVMLEYEGVDGTMLSKMHDRRELKSWEAPRASEMLEGKVVQIAIPDLGLMLIDEVTNLDDCCTDELQRYLSDGWRLLAVCPPNAQRRPDYILGRRKQRVTE